MYQSYLSLQSLLNCADLLHGLFLLCVSIFLIHPGEEFVELFFLLDLPVFIGFLSEGLIIL